MAYKIVTDTSSNLPLSELNKHGITQVPFGYTEDGNTFLTCMDIENFDGHGYYERIKKGLKVTTSQINPQLYIDYIDPLLKEGNDILYIGMSSGISGSYNSSQMAKSSLSEDYPDRKIYTIDTRAASLGEGILVLEAAKLCEQGMDIDTCYETITKMCDNMYQIFTVDDLMHLKRTGRLSNAGALIGTMLNIKPLLKGNDTGQIVGTTKVRGTKKAIQALADKYNGLVTNPQDQVIGISHADNPEDVATLIELLNKDKPPKSIMTVMFEPVTGSHVGPGTMALFFMGDSDVRSK